MKKYVLAGASYRCYYMFYLPLVDQYNYNSVVTGVYDINKTRCEFFKKKGGDTLNIYDDYDKMLDTEKPDVVIVTTVDSTHHDFIIRALEKGCDVLSEKPITNTYERCLAIREAEKRTGHKVTTTFNARFSPVTTEIKKIISGGKLGKVLHVSYDHYLNRAHGGDYFKRWHRKMENSQGMMLHKSTHCFDLMNWLIDDMPEEVNALGNRIYYGDASKVKGERCSKCPYLECESRASQSDIVDQDLYFNAEHEDGYIRDKCAFLPDADILDSYSVSVKYRGGAIMSYSLNLFSFDEGSKMVFTCEYGMIECIRNKIDHLPYHVITIKYRDGKSEEIHLPKLAGSHGGSDARLVDMLFSGKEFDNSLGHHADSYAGVASAMVGIAVNESIATKQTINLTERLEKLK